MKEISRKNCPRIVVVIVVAVVCGRVLGAPELMAHSAVALLGGADRPGPRVTPFRGVTPEGKKFLWANLQRIVDKRGRTGKKCGVTPSRGATPE